jgi:hypothetical protein
MNDFLSIQPDDYQEFDAPSGNYSSGVISGGGYGLQGDYSGQHLTPAEVSTDQAENLPTVTITAPQESSPTAVDAALGSALSRTFGIGAENFAIGLAEGLEVGAESGIAFGPAGILIGSAVGAGLAFYIFKRR